MKYTPPIPDYQEETGYLADHNKKFNDLRKYFYHHEKEEIWQPYPKFHIPPRYNDLCRGEFVKTKIDKHEVVKNPMNREGISETLFISKVLEKFKSTYIKDAVLPGKGGLPIVPDILLHDSELNFYLDIEIDEPYVWTKNIETHYAGSDSDRDFDILYANWFIIRFTERQIVKNPESCLLHIERAIDCIRSLVQNNTYVKFQRNTLLEEPAWAKSDCTTMMLNDYRNEYLASITNNSSQISKSMSSTKGDSVLIDRWFALPDIWRKVIIESIFSEEYTIDYKINSKQAKYLLSLEEFNVWGATPRLIERNLNKISFQLHSLKGIEQLKFLNNIRNFDFSHNLIDNIEPLSCFTGIEALSLWENPVVDISPISEMKNLFHLNLSNTNVEDISCLKNLPKLANISLDSTCVRDISSLFEIKKPNSISLQFNRQIPKEDVDKLRNQFPNIWIHY